MVDGRRRRREQGETSQGLEAEARRTKRAPCDVGPGDEHRDSASRDRQGKSGVDASLRTDPENNEKHTKKGKLEKSKSTEETKKKTI